MADEVVLVTTPDPTSLRDSYAMAKVLNKRTGLRRVQLVTNLVGSEIDGLAIHEKLEAIVRRFLTLELAYLGCVPRDSEVQASVASGNPFVLRAPRSHATRALQTVVRRLSPSTEPRSISC